tara:strand:- start:3297 stop:4004 length:708 start_codon:yes stop_codon:yes gene_type:complete
MLTLVTGADTRKYFNYLKQNLNNVINVGKNKNIDIQIIVYNLGMSDDELNQIKSFEYVMVKNFDFNKYPEHVSLEKYYGVNCSYAWKPIIIHEVCEEYGGLVHWMDTRNLYFDFNNLIKILQENYIYTPTSSGSVQRWTYPTTLKYMNGSKYRNHQMRNAAVVGVNYDIDWVKTFIKKWKDLALVKECICPENSNRINHRQDQSVLTLLYYQYEELYKFKVLNDYVNFSIHNDLY